MQGSCGSGEKLEKRSGSTMVSAIDSNYQPIFALYKFINFNYYNAIKSAHDKLKGKDTMTGGISVVHKAGYIKPECQSD
ncbi:MAG: hypothetical protein KJP23_26840 [Deltaproteobacteria bacterium]|nr:hypothetical protein [Deltaproteobacteria bacterium]